MPPGTTMRYAAGNMIVIGSRVEGGAYALTEMGNAERFAEQHAGLVRYCWELKSWLVYDGTRWVLNDVGSVEQLAKDTVRSIYREAADGATKDERDSISRWASASERSSQITGMLRLAQSEPSLRVHDGELDRDPWLFNVLNGTIDLRTGTLRPHASDDYLTKIAPVEHQTRTAPERWERFLHEIFEHQPELPEFMQRAVGYSLSGSTREECFFLLHGEGRNGKGVLISIISALFGDYAVTTDFSAFVTRRNDGPRDDVAVMKGKRFVSAQESCEGARFDESLVKTLTGGDKVRARRLYSNSIEFNPTWKIWLATNHRPVIRGTDTAIWSRIRDIPFETSFEGREDRNLKQDLIFEMPGILGWAIEGCQRWQADGLWLPSSVIDATQTYRTEQDEIGRFLEERCRPDASSSVRAVELYDAYRDWAGETGDAVSQKNFGTRVSRYGVQKHRSGAGVLYRGFALK